MAPPRNRPNTTEVFADVTVRFREHEQYGSRAAALKALGRRCPGLAPAQCARLFDFYLPLLDATIDALEQFLKSPRFAPPGPSAAPSDIDERAILVRLRRRFRGTPEAKLRTFLGWVVFWHYLK